MAIPILEPLVMMGINLKWNTENQSQWITLSSVKCHFAIKCQIRRKI